MELLEAKDHFAKIRHQMQTDIDRLIQDMAAISAEKDDFKDRVRRLVSQLVADGPLL